MTHAYISLVWLCIAASCYTTYHTFIVLPQKLSVHLLSKISFYSLYYFVIGQASWEFCLTLKMTSLNVTFRVKIMGDMIKLRRVPYMFYISNYLPLCRFSISSIELFRKTFLSELHKLTYDLEPKTLDLTNGDFNIMNKTFQKLFHPIHISHWLALELHVHHTFILSPKYFFSSIEFSL